MYHISVSRIKYGFWGPKFIHVFRYTTDDFAEVSRVLEPYDGDPRFSITLIDSTAFYPPTAIPEENIDDRELPIPVHHDHEGAEVPF